jgi:hypothetical protein
VVPRWRECDSIDVLSEYGPRSGRIGIDDLADVPRVERTKLRILRSLTRRESGRDSRSFAMMSLISRSRETRAARNAGEKSRTAMLVLELEPAHEIAHPRACVNSRDAIRTSLPGRDGAGVDTSLSEAGGALDCMA